MTIGVVQQVGTQIGVASPLHTTHTVTLPSSPTAGNLLTLVAISSDGSASITPPAGWTTRYTAAGTSGTAQCPAMLVATKVACPGESSSVTVTIGGIGMRRSNLHVFEVNGGYGGVTSNRQGFGDTPGFGTSHYFPAITPTGSVEALLLASIVNENAYGITSGPGGGYTNIASTTSNDGASDTLNTFSQHIASTSGSYGGSGLPIVYSASCVTDGVQVWYKAALDSSPCSGPIADFTGTPLFGTDPLTVTFTDTSTNTPTSWLWDFGDGGTSTAQNPTHVYAAPGIYTVQLTATNAGGSDSESKTGYVAVAQAFALDVYRILPPGDSIAYVATLSDAFNRGIRPVRNEPGSGTFTINRNSPNASAGVMVPGNLVKVRIPLIHSGYLFAWFMGAEEDTVISTDEEGGEDIVKGGLGALSYWDRARWLSSSFVIPWWDGAWGTPPTGARGHVTFVAGTYRRYTIAGGVITGYTNFTTAGFEAYFDTRRTWDWPSAGSDRFLVHIMTGETNAGWYVHPHQDGVTETLPSMAVGTSSTVLLSDISPDTPGAILYHLFQEATDPGRPTQPIPLMSIDFTATTDSNGDPWATTDALAGLTVELGESYLQTIATLLSTGVIDVEMGPDLDMHAWNSQGRDLTGTTFGAGKVRFVKGVNIADELRRERPDDPVGTFIEVVGTDNAIGQAVLPDAASRVAREISGTGDSADETVLDAIGLAILNAQLAASDALGFRIATGDNDAAGLYLPGPEGSDHGDFWLGDVVTLDTGTGDTDFNQADERVAAISISEDEAGNLEVTPEVGSALGEAERRLYAGVGGKTVSFTSRSTVGDTPVAETAHPDLATHDALGLATDAELAASVGVPSSPITMRYTFSTTTTDSDPGAGNLRLSNATQYLAVTIRADLTDSDAVDVTALLDAIATAGTGYVRLQKRDDPTKWLVATLSASASPSGYRNLTIANIAKSANSPFANGDLLLLSFIPTSGGGGGSGTLTTIKDEGSTLSTAVASLDFVGAGVTATGTTAVTVTIPGGGASSHTVLSDTFNRANGAVGDADGGPLQRWYIASGTWDINSNRLRETGAGSERFIMAHAGFPHTKRTFVWTMNTKPTSGDGGLVWRMTPAGACLLLNAEATYKLYSQPGGAGYTAVTVVSGTPVAPANGDVITVIDDGYRITVTVNGGAAVVYDTLLPTGSGAWVGFRNSGGGGMTHDSIVVTDT